MRSRGKLTISFAALLLLLLGLFLSLRHKTAVPTRIIPMSSETLALTYSPDGRFLAAGQQVIIKGHDKRGYWAYGAGKVQIRNMQSGVVTEFPFIKQASSLYHTMNGPVSSLSYSPDGKWLMAGSPDTVLGVAEAATGRWIFCVRLEHSGQIYKAVGFTADSRDAVYADITEDRAAKRQDTAEAWKRARHITNLIFRQTDTGKIVKQLKNILEPGEWPTQFQFLRSPNLIAIATKLGDDSDTLGKPAKIVLLDANTGTRIKSAPLEAEPNNFLFAGSINTMTADARGDNLAVVTSDGRLSVWNMQARQPVTFPVPKGKNVWNITMSEDGKKLAGATIEGTVLIWDVPERKLVESLETHVKWTQGMAFSPDSKMLATTGEDYAVKLWAMK